MFTIPNVVFPVAEYFLEDIIKFTRYKEYEECGLCSLTWYSVAYLKVTIIYRCIFLRSWFKTCFVSTKFCDLYAEVVQGRQILMFYST